MVRGGGGGPPADAGKRDRASMEHDHVPLRNSSPPGCGLGYVPVVYYSLLLCLGLPANILTVIILSQLVARRQKSSYNYLLALAAADLLVLFFIVFVDFLLEDFVLKQQMPEVLDRIVDVLEFSSIHTSIWITVPLTIDRYIAVCHPLKYHMVSYPARTRKVIVSVYIICFLTSIPYYWWPKVWLEDYKSTLVHHIFIWVHCFTIYLVPCSIFSILNSIIVYKLRQKCHFRLRGYSTGKTTAILFTITSIFAILWAPRIIMILYHLYVSPKDNRRSVHIVSDVANMLALLNTAINFFLYCFISKRFRTMAAATLKAFLKCQKQPVQFYTNHNFSITSSPWISPANSHCIKMLVYQYDKNGKPIKISP
ncbi:putative G-protein coupled receptor 139 [Paroedura picta]|uniref:putative G-protein coupled receptor 139 n=1 Tax=Paroedura picta TaxID=143630 RepID=UPI0040571DA8